MFNIYFLPDCGQCAMTEKLLKRLNKSFIVFDLTILPDKMAVFQQLGYTCAPVVEVVDDTGGVVDCWCGFRPEKIKKYASTVTVTSSVGV